MPHQPALADELFLTALDPHVGRPFVAEQVISLGLAAALLAELIFAGRLSIRDERLVITSSSPPSDVLGHTVLAKVIAERSSHPTNDWLSYLGQDSYAKVADRMVMTGSLRVESRRKLMSKVVAHFPVDPSDGAWPLARLRRYLSHPQPGPINSADAFLLSAAAAIGMRQALLENGFRDTRETARNRLDTVAGMLPPTLDHLIRHLTATVGAAVQTYRT